MFPGGGGRCTGRARRCEAKQRRRGKTAPTYGSYFHNSTVFAPRTRGVKDFFSNHGWALFLSHRRRHVDFGIGVCGSLVDRRRFRGRNLSRNLLSPNCLCFFCPALSRVSILTSE